MKFFNLLTLVSVVVLSGCARQYPAIEDMPQRKASPVTAVPKAPIDPSLVEGPTWKMTLEAPVLWKKEALGAPDPLGDTARTELYAQTESGIGLEVLVGEHTDEDIAFIKELLQTMQDSTTTKIVKLKEVKTASGEVAALVLSVSAREDGPILTFRLITSNAGHGYVVACGGVGPRDIEKAGALCLKTMQTFTIKGEPAKGDKKPAAAPQVPISTPESTQTLNDVHL